MARRWTSRSTSVAPQCAARRCSASRAWDRQHRPPSGATAWKCQGRGRATKRPEEPAVRQLAHRQSRLLAIVDPPPGPLPTALRSSVRSPGTIPEIAPRSGSTVNVGPFRQDLEWMFEAIRTRDLSTNWPAHPCTCPPNERWCGRNVQKPVGLSEELGVGDPLHVDRLVELPRLEFDELETVEPARGMGQAGAHEEGLGPLCGHDAAIVAWCARSIGVVLP